MVGLANPKGLNGQLAGVRGTAVYNISFVRYSDSIARQFIAESAVGVFRRTEAVGYQHAKLHSQLIEHLTGASSSESEPKVP